MSSAEDSHGYVEDSLAECLSIFFDVFGLENRFRTDSSPWRIFVSNFAGPRFNAIRFQLPSKVCCVQMGMSFLVENFCCANFPMDIAVFTLLLLSSSRRSLARGEAAAWLYFSQVKL